MNRLFTTWYDEADSRRRAEYVQCLNANLAHASIGEVCVLAEGGEDCLPVSTKLSMRPVASRPTYDQFFSWITELSQPDDVAIIANTDIHFDATLDAALRSIESDECFALARWDGFRLFDRNDSQDAWMFRGGPRNVIGNFHLGTPRCDNRLIHELRAAGYRVRNPSFAVRALHVHATERIEYATDASSAWVGPPYGYVWPTNLFSFFRTILYNRSHPSQAITWRLDRRSNALTMPRKIVSKVRRTLSVGSRRS